MHLLFFAALLISPTDRGALMAPVTAWVHAFNSGQTTFPTTAFTDDCTVIDEFAPFAWSPDHANVRTWYSIVVGATSPKDRAEFLAGHEHLSLGEPTYVRVKAGGANLTFPAMFAFDDGGKHHVQRAMFTVAERKTPAGWRIAAHAWALISDS